MKISTTTSITKTKYNKICIFKHILDGFGRMDKKRPHGKKSILLQSLVFLLGYFTLAQMAVHGDVFIASEGTLAFHGEELHFFQGHIHTDELRPGQLMIGKLSHAFSPSHNAHSVASVHSLGHTNFIFPVGDQGIYQPMARGSMGFQPVASCAYINHQGNSE